MGWNGPEPPGWRAAHESAVGIRRADLAGIRVFGRDPVRMLQGLLTNEVAGLPIGGSVYSALLTPRGRLLADLRAIRRPDDVLLICDVGAAANVRDTLRKYVPPLFARFEDVENIEFLGVYGPLATRLVERLLDANPSPGDGGAAAAPRGEAPAVGTGAEPSGGEPGHLATIREDHGVYATISGAGFHVIRDLDAGVAGWLLVGSGQAVSSVESELAGVAATGDLETFDLLRFEAGRPRWGAELTEEVIPIEAGLTERAISTGKGCYTGQEVIIRILHRGHVNRRLMGLRLGMIDPPAPATQLFLPGEAKAVARLTSAARSPSLRETVAMGYVRREIDAGTVLALGSPDGPEATVIDLPFVN